MSFCIDASFGFAVTGLPAMISHPASRCHGARVRSWAQRPGVSVRALGDR
jgi:hypothetical protein